MITAAPQGYGRQTRGKTAAANHTVRRTVRVQYPHTVRLPVAYKVPDDGFLHNAAVMARVLYHCNGAAASPAHRHPALTTLCLCQASSCCQDARTVMADDDCANNLQRRRPTILDCFLNYGAAPPTPDFENSCVKSRIFPDFSRHAFFSVTRENMNILYNITYQYPVLI